MTQLKEEALGLQALSRRVERAQRLVRQYIKPRASLADELIAERRAEAGRPRDSDEGRQEGAFK